MPAVLACGRVDLNSIEADWALPAPVFDAPLAVARLNAEGPASALQGLAP